MPLHSFASRRRHSVLTTTWLSVESTQQPAVNNRVALRMSTMLVEDEAALGKPPGGPWCRLTTFGSYSRASIRITGEHFLPEYVYVALGTKRSMPHTFLIRYYMCEAPPRIPSDVELRVSVDNRHWSAHVCTIDLCVGTRPSSTLNRRRDRSEEVRASRSREGTSTGPPHVNSARSRSSPPSDRTRR